MQVLPNETQDLHHTKLPGRAAFQAKTSRTMWTLPGDKQEMTTKGALDKGNSMYKALKAVPGSGKWE